MANDIYNTHSHARVVMCKCTYAYKSLYGFFRKKGTKKNMQTNSSDDLLFSLFVCVGFVDEFILRTAIWKITNSTALDTCRIRIVQCNQNPKVNALEVIRVGAFVEQQRKKKFGKNLLELQESNYSWHFSADWTNERQNVWQFNLKSTLS